MKTRVLIVSDYFYPHWTGISKSLYNLTQNLKNRLEFTVLTTRFKSSLKPVDNVDGVRIIRSAPLFSFSRAKYSLDLIIRYSGLVKDIDTVLINSPFTNILPVTVIGRLLGKKIVVFHQGDLILPKSPMNRVIEKIFDISTVMSFLLADKVTTYTLDYGENSRVLRPFLKKFSALLPPFYVAKNAADLSIPKGIRFGFAGRFVEEKGFDVLFNAIPKVISTYPDAKFVFAGETNMEYENFYEKCQTLLKPIKGSVIFSGRLDDKKLSDYYHSLDLIIIPSRSDCFPLVQAEAMLSRVPSVVADIPGARELVKKTGFGLIFRKEDPDDLAEKIIEAYRKKDQLIKNFSKVEDILNNDKNGENFRICLEK